VRLVDLTISWIERGTESESWRIRRRIRIGLVAAFAALALLVQVGTPAEAKTTAPNKVMASGDHWKITESELDQEAKPEIELLQNMMKQARARALNAMVNRRVLEEAAKARHLTPEQYLKREVDDKVPPVSDAAAKAFYNQHKNLFSEPYGKVSDKLKVMLRTREISGKRAAFIEALRKKADVKIELPMPTESAVGRRPGASLGLRGLLKQRIPAAGTH
jgi:hypothetical protein